ncbi:Ornithine carbamoyltransferase [invertebrate metagenome]|uniref:ornithine carbamoyltransferase n=1 Tax=invertebrate metagenome TaxID=1711999 RepID=A0A484HA13_9ZZZZ
MTTTCEPLQAAVRHFLDLEHLETGILRHILNTGHLYRRHEEVGGLSRPLVGRILALVFEKPSTRTRVSFEVGMRQLGGDVVVLTYKDTQLGRGETIADTARVLSRYVDAVMLRTSTSENLHEMAYHASVPIINGLTHDSHPCQVMADILTFEQHRGSLAGRVIAWCGDGNNVAVSWIQAAPHFGFRLRLACPESLMPQARSVTCARDKGADITLTTDPREAVQNADCVVTDTWASMGLEEKSRPELLRSYQVNAALMALAHPEALFMHCLPAHRNEEVTDEIIDGPHSVVWDEAENRLHVQKGILMWCLA